jgi:tellurite resistance protein TehA-like permease
MGAASGMNGDAEGQRGSKAKHRLSILQNFPSQWFLVPQGTGIIAVILHQLDYQFHGLAIISYIFWILTIILLFTTVTLYVLRAAVFKSNIASALRSSTAELNGLASISIASTSILQMAVLTLARSWKGRWPQAIYGLWWFNVLLALASSVLIPFVITTRARNILDDDPPVPSDAEPGQQTKPKATKPVLPSPSFTPAAQLPLISALTVAAGGGTIANYAGLSSSLTAPMIVVSYILVGMALPLALALDTIFLARVLLLLPEGGHDPHHEQPPKEGRSSPSAEQQSHPVAGVSSSIFQDMIMCGPWGQGSFALQGLGQAILKGGLVGGSDGSIVSVAATGPIAYASMFAGLLAWGAGTFWWAFAVLSLVGTLMRRKTRRRIKFGLVAWSVIFPWVS